MGVAFGAINGYNGPTGRSVMPNRLSEHQPGQTRDVDFYSRLSAAPKGPERSHLRG